jgi:hypothetical protein
MRSFVLVMPVISRRQRCHLKAIIPDECIKCNVVPLVVIAVERIMANVSTAYQETLDKNKLNAPNDRTRAVGLLVYVCVCVFVCPCMYDIYDIYTGRRQH